MIGYRSVYKSTPKGQSAYEYTCVIVNNALKVSITQSKLSNEVRNDRYNFNKGVYFGENVFGFDSFFSGCSNLNSPMYLEGQNVVSYNSMFVSCRNFNQPVNIRDKYMPNCVAMFQHCWNLNSPITIASANNASNLFASCFILNSNITIDKLNIGFRLFAECNNLNSTISIHTANNLAYAFFNCKNFNQPFIIPEEITQLSYTFQNCKSFNQPITFPRNFNCSYLVGMLEDATNYNCPIEIPNTNYALSCYRMLFNTAFNQPITITSFVNNCAFMFYFGAINQPITILSELNSPELNCACMLNSSAYDKDLIVPARVSNLAYTLANSKDFGSNLYIKGTTYKNINTYGLLQGTNNSKRKNIHFNSSLNNLFNIATSRSIVGATITWTTMTNGFYNSTYNVYCYYNYSG